MRISANNLHLVALLPDGDENTWFKIINKKFDASAKAHYALLQALNNDDIARVIHCKSAYKI